MTHSAILLVHMQFLLNKVCQLLGYDYADRDTIYNFTMSDVPFGGYQVGLRRMDAVPQEANQGNDYYYAVETSTIGDFRAEPRVPEFFNGRYFKRWPDYIFFKLEETDSSEIVN